MKAKITKQSLVNMIGIALIVVLIVLQFVPYWTVNSQDSSIGGFICLPSNHMELQDYFAGEIEGEYSINSVVGAPILVMFCCIGALILCIMNYGNKTDTLGLTAFGVITLATYSSSEILKLGNSCGIHMLLCTAVLVIVADCGYSSAHAVWRHVVEEGIHLPYDKRWEKMISKIYKEKLNLDAQDCSCVEALKNSKVPILFIHGADDKFVPVEMTYENYEACAAPEDLLIVPGAEHGLSYWVNQEEYERVVTAFWEKYDSSNVITQ